MKKPQNSRRQKGDVKRVAHGYAQILGARRWCTSELRILTLETPQQLSNFAGMSLVAHNPSHCSSQILIFQLS